jgi:hypothetical protein
MWPDDKIITSFIPLLPEWLLKTALNLLVLVTAKMKKDQWNK